MSICDLDMCPGFPYNMVAGLTWGLDSMEKHQERKGETDTERHRDSEKQEKATLPLRTSK